MVTEIKDVQRKTLVDVSLTAMVRIQEIVGIREGREKIRASVFLQRKTPVFV